MKKFTGFSLIELMIVVVIIGILAVMAMPSYQQYTKRTRFVEVIAAANIYKTAVALALQQDIAQNELTNGNHGIPLAPPPTRNLAKLSVENGVITATATTLADNATLIMSPDGEGSTWTIAGTCIEAGYCHA
jgi:prepilin-type N-terminal cleavage/methylation domain-containing protein